MIHRGGHCRRPHLDSTRDYWALHLKSEGLAERTISTYLNALRRLDEFLASRGMPRELRAIRREHLEAWVADMLQRNQPGTVLIGFRSARPFFKGWWTRTKSICSVLMKTTTACASSRRSERTEAG